MKALIRKLGNIHPDHQRIFKGAFRVAVFLLLGKAAGAVKEMAVAYRYGVSDAVDAYQFTMTMATWLPVTIVGVLSVVLIPVLAGCAAPRPPNANNSSVNYRAGWPRPGSRWPR